MSAFRQQLIAALDSLDSSSGRPRFSDFDLNPDAPRLDSPLRPAAVLIPVVDHVDGPTLLLTRRSDSLASHTGQIAFPGGRLDPGETVVQAALREAAEEVGLSPDHVAPLGLSDAYETVTGFLVTPVVAWVRPGFTLTTDPREVADAFETPWDFLMDEANHRREFYDAPDGTRRWFWAMPWGERYIWGATAGMLRSLWGRLHDPAREAVA